MEDRSPSRQAAAPKSGKAVFRREPIIVEDIATDPLWQNDRQFALPLGLRACWSTPIFQGCHRVSTMGCGSHRFMCLPHNQEALRNVIKHAQTDRAEVALAESGKDLTLTISDHGPGGTRPQRTLAVVASPPARSSVARHPQRGYALVDGWAR